MDDNDHDGDIFYVDHLLNDDFWKFIIFLSFWKL